MQNKLKVIKPDTREYRRETALQTLKDAVKHVEDNPNIDSVYIIMSNTGQAKKRIASMQTDRFWGGSANDLEVLGTLDIVMHQHKEFMRR